MSIDLRLPCEPGSVGVARDALSALDLHLSERRLGDLRLLVSEVVTNAVRHAGLTRRDHIRLLVRHHGDRVRVEVLNPGRGFPVRPRRASLSSPGGWGLFLVEQLASEWGVEGNGETLVWFELAA